MSFTFATLKTAIQDYSENTETTFTNNLSNFIKIAEERILKNVQLSIFRKNATAAFTSSNEFLACPNDFLTPFSLSFTDASSNKVFLDYKDVNFIQTFTPNSSTKSMYCSIASAGAANSCLICANNIFSAPFEGFSRPAIKIPP